MTDLPSGEHARAFVESPSAANAVQLGVDVVARAALIAVGMQLFRRGRRRSNFKEALAGSAGIELFVLLFMASQARRQVASK